MALLGRVELVKGMQRLLFYSIYRDHEIRSVSYLRYWNPPSAELIGSSVSGLLNVLKLNLSFNLGLN